MQSTSCDMPGWMKQNLKLRLPGEISITSDVQMLLLLLLLGRFSLVRLCVTPETAAHQAPPSLGFSRQEHWSRVPLSSPNMLSRLTITFHPRSKRLLISWLQSPSAVSLEPQKYKVSHCFHCLPIYLPRSDGTGCHDLSFLNVEL